MATFLKIWGIVAILFALLALAQQASAVQQTVTGLALLIATVSFGFAKLIDIGTGLLEHSERNPLPEPSNERATIFRYCSQCNAMLNDDDEKCPGCGLEIEATA